MSNHLYKIGTDFLFKESDKPAKRILRFLGIAAVVGVAIMIVAYCVFALTINTDLEGRLKRENKMYEKLYPQLVPQQQLLDDAVKNLELKDGAIYTDIFQSEAPSADPVQTLSFLSVNDTIKNNSLIAYASAKSDTMYSKISSIEANLVSALAVAAKGGSPSLPPLGLPLQEVSFMQLGASIGVKTNPWLKAKTGHDGLDIIISTGAPVLASGYGKVTDVEKSNNGFGNRVTISHAGGYVTRYAHLSSISVKKGQMVKKGQKIGNTGMSGSTFAPHLHYEVLRNGKYLDPVNFFFASVGVEEYVNMLYIASNTQQSMD